MLEDLRPPEMKGKPAKGRNDYAHNRHFDSGFDFCKEKMLNQIDALLTRAMDDDSVSKSEFAGMMKVQQLVRRVK